MLKSPPPSSSKKADTDSPAIAALKCAYHLMEQRIISNPRDMMGILLYGTQDSKFYTEEGDTPYPHCYLLQDVDIPSAQDVKELRDLVEDEEHAKSILQPSDEGVSMSNVLFCANQIFTTKAANFTSRRLFLVTDNDNPHENNKTLRQASAVRARDLYDLGVTIELFPISKPDQEFDRAKFYDDIVYSSLPNDPEFPGLPEEQPKISSGDGLSLLSSLLQSVTSKNVPKRAQFSNIPLELGPGLTISVNGYLIFKRQAPQRSCYIWQKGEKPQIVKGFTTLQADDTAREVQKPEVRKAYTFGGEQISFSEEEQKKLRNFGPPVIRVLGFKPLSDLPFWASVKHSTLIYPSEADYVGSTRVFSALWQTLLKKERWGLTWYIPRRNAAPRMAAMLAADAKLDDNGNPAIPPGLWMLPLPFVDDIRHNPPTTHVVAPEGLVQKMSVIVEQLLLPGALYNPMRYPNPALQYHYKILQAIALDEDLPEKPVDKTLPKYKQIDKRAGPYVLDWEAELKKAHAEMGLDKDTGARVAPASKKRAPAEGEKADGGRSRTKKVKTEEEGGNASKRGSPMATDEDHTEDVHTITRAWESGSLAKCTAAQLRGFLASHGEFPKANVRKPEVIEMMRQTWIHCPMLSAATDPPGGLDDRQTQARRNINFAQCLKLSASSRTCSTHAHLHPSTFPTTYRPIFWGPRGRHDVPRNNVAKLLYLFTLGERTHFGQIECLKLLASPRFADKRLGYLGTMLLLDENQEVLTLVTNSLKKLVDLLCSPCAAGIQGQDDLNHSNQYVVGLALCTLGNIASDEMARDLFPEIESLVSTANPYIRRKAALCAMKICRKAPDLQEHFVDKIKALLSDRNHGVLLCGLTVAIEFCLADEEEGSTEVINQFRPLVPQLVKSLKSLTTAGYSPEHDVSGITDPFLQVKILRFFRVLGHGSQSSSELMNDILAQVATNTDASKNVGNSILYETVLTILDIEADSGLRVLGVNILGKFLLNKDNNIRYVALNTLNKVVAVEPNAVQRHRNTILECLRDADISIRRRALDLSFTLINESNVRVLVRELLAFLEVADNEFKPSMTTQIGIAADRFAPNKRWHVDTMLRVLKLAGAYVKEQILSSFVRLIATTPELQTYSAQKLYAALREDISQEGLTLAAAWVIGEYGDSLLKGGQYEEEELVTKVQESDIVDLFTSILNSTYATQIVTEYITTSAMKLTTRMSEPAQIERLRRLLSLRTADLDVEIQQRAVEYTNLFGYDSIRHGVLEKMPPPEIREEQRVLGLGATGTKMSSGRKPARTLVQKNGKKPASKQAECLLSTSTDTNAVFANDPTFSFPFLCSAFRALVSIWFYRFATHQILFYLS
ncbi:clathrin associated protein complex large subunit [Ascosphaera atra]|nr:clathrin associated protein complex large subunit [Ascosphaera atra]